MNDVSEKSDNNRSDDRKTARRSSAAELPMVDLAGTLEFVAKIESKGLQTLTGAEVAKRLGFAAPTSTPFYRRMSAARLFGLVDTAQGVNLTKLALDYFKPTDEESKKAALFGALRSVVAYQKILDRYNGRRLPQADIVTHLIEREFNLTAEGANVCATAFCNSVQQAGAVQTDGTLLEGAPPRGTASQTKHRAEPESRVGSFGVTISPSEDSEAHFLTLDAKRGRRVIVQGPPEITAAELKRIQSWLAVQLRVVDSLGDGEPQLLSEPDSGLGNGTAT